jgi:hypothetical protein
MVEIQINGRQYRILIVCLFVVVLTGLTLAYGDFMNNEATINGHTSDEIMVKDKAGTQVSLQSYIDNGGLTVATDCEDYVTSVTTTYNFNTYCAANQTGGGCATISDGAESPYSICPAERPFVKGFAFFDNDGLSLGTIYSGRIVVECCSMF